MEHLIVQGTFFEKLSLYLTVIFWAPLIEELLIRGFLWRTLKGSKRWRIGFTGVLFGVLHVGNPQSILPLCIFGVLLGILRERSDSLVPAILAHLFYNLMIVLQL